MSPCLNTVVRKPKKLYRFTNTESFDSNKHHKFINTELSPCLNTVVNRPVVSLFELQLAKKWDNLIRPIPHSITVAPSCMPITSMQNMRQTFRQCTVVPKFFSTLQFSYDDTSQNNKSVLDLKSHLDQTDQFLSHYIRHWVSFNSRTGDLASKITKVFPQQIEVTIAQPTYDLCDVCHLTTSHELIVRSTVATFSSLLDNRIPPPIISNAKYSRYSLERSVLRKNTVHILGIDIHFESSYSIPPEKKSIKELEDGR